MFIAILFIVAKTWKQARCLSEGELINNPDSRILFSAKKQKTKTKQNKKQDSKL